MLWILACAAAALLCYEIPTLLSAVVLPLLNNPGAIQTDFHYYHDAARRFLADPGRLYLATDDVIAGFTYPPPAILPFAMLARLPLGQALLLTTVATYLALLTAIWQWTGYLRRRGITADRRSLTAAVVIALSLGPVYMNAISGQVNAFVLASAVAFVTLAETAPVLAGVALSLGAWLKIYPALVLWIGLWERRARLAIASAAAAAIAVAGFALVWVPAEAYRYFVSTVLPARSGYTAIHFTNQSLAAFLERFRYEPALFLNWTGQQAVEVSSVVRLLVAGLLVAAVAALFRWVRPPQRGAHAAAVLMALVPIVAPLGWGHTYVMVLPLILLRLIELPAARGAAAAITTVSIIAFMIPAGRHLSIDAFPAWLQNLVYSRYLLATIALIALPLDTRQREA